MAESARAYYNDSDPYCCAVLRKNIAAGHLPLGDVDEQDIRSIQPVDLTGYRQIHLFAGIGGMALACRIAGLPDDVSICTGGFPCQDISIAGRRAGIEGQRSGLWSEMARLLGALRPRYVLVENVPALLKRGMGRVLGDLAACGYDAEWECLSAASVGAPHIRDRVFILAYPQRERGDRRPSPAHDADRADAQWQEETGAPAACRADGWAGPAAHADGQRRAQQRGTGPGPASDAGPERGGEAAADANRRRHGAPQEPVRPRWHSPEHSSWWSAEPGICRVASGVPHRVDRLRGLGNSVVPQVAAVALRVVAQMEREEEQVHG